MEPEPTVLDSLRKAIDAMPDDVPLRLHLATLLLGAGQRDEAVRHLGAVLQRDPGNAQAMSLLTDPGRPPARAEAAGPPPPPDPAVISAERAVLQPRYPRRPPGRMPLGRMPLGRTPAGGRRQGGRRRGGQAGEVRLVTGGRRAARRAARDVRREGEAADSASAGIDEADAYDAEHAGLTLADVAGMTEVKQRLEAAFLAPMRNRN